jgi:pilus assembly protein CpaB
MVRGLQAIRQRWAAWRTVGLVAGMLGFGLLAALGAYRYIQERVEVERARLGVTHERVEVLVAARALQRGEAVGTANLAVRSLPREVIPGGALSPSRIDAVQGLRLQWPMQAGEPLLSSAVFAAESAGLSSRLRLGVRALTIAVDETNAISGLLQPGDRIDLLLSWRPAPVAGVSLPELTRTVMQDVVVIATGRNARAVPSEDAPGRTFSAITVEVDPEQAQKLVVAQRSGRLTAVLRNPSDRESHEDRLLDVHDLMGIARPTGSGMAGVLQAMHGAQHRASVANQAIPPAGPLVQNPQGAPSGRQPTLPRSAGDPGVEVIVGGRGPLSSAAGASASTPISVGHASNPRSAASPAAGSGSDSGQIGAASVQPAAPAGKTLSAWPDLSPPTTVPLLR